MEYEITYNNKTVDDLIIQDRRREIVHLLSNHNCEVTFTKLDGTVRVMPCTLRKDALPITEGHTVKDKKSDSANLSVWCTDKQAWRSFRIGNVQIIRTVS